ncbi:MAG: tetratricopeptide repeat protein [Planctomycetota bacterium]
MRHRRLLGAGVLGVGLLLGAVGCTNHVVHRERGFDAYRAQDWTGAEEEFRTAVEKKPSDFRSQYYLGATLLKQGRATAAQVPLEQALQLRQDDPQWRPRIADLLAETYFQQERYEALYGFLDDQIATYSQQSIDFTRKAKYLGLLGDADGQKTALQKAAFFAAADDAEPYLAIAEFYLSVNDFENAVQALRFGYYVDPENERVADMLRGLGKVPGPTLAEAPPKPELLD